MPRPEGCALLALLFVAFSPKALADTTSCLTDTGNVVLQSTSTIVLELTGTTPCTQYDRYTVSQTLTLQGGTLDVTVGNGFVPAAGQSFQILGWGTLVGTFGALTLPTLSQGLVWSTSALYTSGTITVTTSNTTSSDGPVPLWALVALGLSLIGIARRRSPAA